MGQRGERKLIIPITKELCAGCECLTSPSVQLLGMGLGNAAFPTTSYLSGVAKTRPSPPFY